mmetsp:Transcript_18853/g.64201  ORF Transcript_18853/g.64201 Transcript_18853/m.64201 type:complete len:82 (+) Transcript_18853:2-247(+)
MASLLSERDGLLADAVAYAAEAAVEHAECHGSGADPAVVAVLGMAHVNGVARALQQQRREPPPRFPVRLEPPERGKGHARP